MNGHELWIEHGKEVLIGSSLLGTVLLAVAGIKLHNYLWERDYQKAKDQATEDAIRLTLLGS